MSANLRFSSHEAEGKKYLGGPLISGSTGIYAPTATASNIFFDEVLKQENIDGTQDYRCLYFQNNFSGQDIYEPQIEFVSMTNAASFSLGLLSDKNVTATTISNENTPPGNVSFSTPANGSPVNLIQGSSKVLLPGEYVGFWLRRTPQNLGTSGTITAEFVIQLRYRT